MDALRNVIWKALSGSQAGIAVGSATARRYAPGFSAIMGFADPEAPDFAALEPHCTPGEALYAVGWNGPAAAGWSIEASVPMQLMLYQSSGPAPVPAMAVQPLQPRDIEPAMALAALTRPGPFGPRTPEMGEYLGIFAQGQLVAMAGERMHVPGLREISGVCTHPAFQGRGYARALTAHLIARQQARGERSFLHVAQDKPLALALYQRMGFAPLLPCTVRVVRYTGPGTPPPPPQV